MYQLYDKKCKKCDELGHICQWCKDLELIKNFILECRRKG